MAALIVAVLLGAIIEYLIIPVTLHDSHYVRQLGDRMADAMIRLGASVRGPHAPAVPFVFVDIDQQTWVDWQMPLVTPRDKLARILSVISNSKPAIIVLDIDLAWPKPEAGDHDEFADFFRTYPASGPPLILLRSAIGGLIPGSRYPISRTTPFDRDIARRMAEQPQAPFHWSTAYFDVDGDGAIRHWRLAEVLCEKSIDKTDRGVPLVLPSVYLTAAVLAAHPQDRARAVESLDATLRQLTPDSCDAPSKPAVSFDDMPHPIVVGAERPGNRIIYSFGWDEDRPALGAHMSFGGEQVPLVSVRPARLLQAAAPSSPLDGLAGRIVILGGSYPDSGDLHRTPLGKMPGALMIANAAHALLVGGTPEEPGFLVRFTLSFGLVVINALLFHFMRAELATFAAAAVIVALMIATLPWFASGVVLDLAVPSIGVLIHRYLVYLEATIATVRRGGWREFFHSHH